MRFGRSPVARTPRRDDRGDEGGGALLATAAPAVARAAPVAQAPPALEVVAEGLDNPRGLTVDRDGNVYVAKAGRGGDDCREVPPQAGLVGTTLCYGPTGSITQVGDGEDVEVVSGLPSWASPDGTAGGGPHDVTTAGPGRFQIVLGGAPVLAEDPGASAQEGRGGQGQVVRIPADPTHTRR